MNWSPVFKWGIIGGLVAIIFDLLLYFVSPTAMVSYYTAVVGLLMMLFFMIWGGIDFRKANNNSISFLEAFGATFLIAIIMGLMGSLFFFMLFKYIDPQLPEVLNQKMTQDMVAMLEKYNTPDAKIEEAVEQIKESGFNADLGSNAFKFLKGFVVYFFMCLVVSIFVKRNPDKIKTSL